MPSLSSPKFVIARNLVLVAGGLLLARASYERLAEFGAFDAFANLRKKVDSPLGRKVGIRMEGVDLRHYTGEKLKAKARVDKLDVSRDRRTFDLLGVHDGIFETERGPVAFAAEHGVWNTLAQHLAVDGNARVKNKDLDLSTTGAEIDRKGQILRVPQPLAGKLYGGDVAATRLDYRLDNGDMDAKSIRWMGKLPLGKIGVVQDVAQGGDATRVWRLAGDGQVRGRIETFENARGEDGEIIIIAPKVVRNKTTDVITATGRVTYYSGKANMVADQVVIYRKERRAVFTGNVVMLVKPKKDQDKKPEISEIPPFRPLVPEALSAKLPSAPVLTDEDKKKDDELRSGKSLRDYPMSINSDEITYWYKKGERHAKIVGHPQARQDFPDGRWRHAWADNADYDAEGDTLKLNSAPGRRDARVKNSIGDDMMAFWLQVSTKEDEDEDNESMDGRGITGTYVNRDDEDPRGPKKTPPTPPVKKPTEPAVPATKPRS